ncbi:putative mitogen-activated protein kinase [Sesbania bispinosa]|nr:putative mitogen-activated protein kinase [Sesbania bispinosa]
MASPPHRTSQSSWSRLTSNCACSMVVSYSSWRWFSGTRFISVAPVHRPHRSCVVVFYSCSLLVALTSWLLIDVVNASRPYKSHHNGGGMKSEGRDAVREGHRDGGAANKERSL